MAAHQPALLPPLPSLSPQVSIDDPPIVLAFMAASLGLAWAGLGAGAGRPGLALTAALAYFSMGLLCECGSLHCGRGPAL